MFAGDLLETVPGDDKSIATEDFHPSLWDIYPFTVPVAAAVLAVCAGMFQLTTVAWWLATYLATIEFCLTPAVAGATGVVVP